MTKRFIPALCWAIGLWLQGMSAFVWAAPDPEEVEPHYYSKLWMLPGDLYFKSPQEAWAYYKPIAQAQLIKNYGPNGHPDILQDLFQAPPSAGTKGYTATINGQPIDYHWHYLRWQGTPNGDAYVQ